MSADLNASQNSAPEPKCFHLTIRWDPDKCDPTPAELETLLADGAALAGARPVSPWEMTVDGLDHRFECMALQVEAVTR